MCGFRIYPVDIVQKLLNHIEIGDYMDFDSEILVCLKWQGYHFVNIATEVKYPEGNTSNFNLVKDNIRISKMHAKLFLLMLIKSPVILYRRIIEKDNG